jgi:RNA polymerase sigma factor (sigma-70 family)
MDERELLDAFRRPATREKAFAELLRRYEPRVFAHGLRMCGNREDAADLSQEVFLKVWRHLDGFEGRSALYSWIYRIAAREALRMLEKAAAPGHPAPGRCSDAAGLAG